MVLPGMGISIIKMRRSSDRLIFIMGIPIPMDEKHDTFAYVSRHIESRISLYSIRFISSQSSAHKPVHYMCYLVLTRELNVGTKLYRI